MSPTSYFTKNIYVTTINLSSQVCLNIQNISVNGDISTNTIYNTSLYISTLSSNSNLISINPTKIIQTDISSNIGHYSNYIVNNTTPYTHSQITSKTTVLTIPNIPAGVYIFTYFYEIALITDIWYKCIYNLYEYIDNTTTSTNLLKKGRTILSDLSVTGNTYETTFATLTSATNTLTLSLQSTNYGSGVSVTFSRFVFTYTRIA